ncbi:glycoside hydrolase family 13 protein [Pelagovum pacificum]|uniref:Alpha-glucosidase n=1 Tax=Pelagovum pacificum TaxID=2588711 RepID=A0A5C5GE53_9RHOB|nr:alpha-glucosidase [Pelagovum pacificum]QQA43881.1 alpha-glucosidase [Pelagovum pacificum]TNY32988.1 alpha-glucosidase [Pelagovum pacificum]
MPKDKTETTPERVNGIARRWWKEAVAYQIYPRSFMDSDGDGVGDLAGIVSKLDYLSDLGVTMVWLSPHYDSPNADNGYDIRDYRAVMSQFGTMDDFDALLDGLHARGIRLIVDLVVNHTSNEHAWFAEARQGKDAATRDYYIWRDPAPDGSPPNNWPSFFSGPAWTLDEASGQYYLHLFAAKQPDLNWDNPAVRGEVWDLMRFWLDKGVDGFRMDVIPFISKDPALPDLPAGIKPQKHYAEGPRLHDYLREMRREVLSHYDCATVGEGNGLDQDQMRRVVDERREELDMIFQFDVVEFDRDAAGNPRDWTLPEFKEIFARQADSMDAHGWTTVYLANHDTTRPVSRYGDDSAEWRVASTKVLNALLLTQKGTPFLYQGDEFGMTNFPFTAIGQFQDIAVRNAWAAAQATGTADEATFLTRLNRTSRDHTRTPMQWDASAEGGFTSGTPWLPVNPNSAEINATSAMADPNGAWAFTRALIELRKAQELLVYGDYRDLAPDHPQVFAFAREIGADGIAVVLNFGASPQTFALPDRPGPVRELLASDASLIGSDVMLGGWSVMICAWGDR